MSAINDGGPAMPDLTTCPWCERYLSRHMDAYYYGFNPTGVESIDRILCSVATAGRGAHHTEHWNEYGYPDLIQRAAQAASAELTRLRAIEARYKADVEKAYREGYGLAFSAMNHEGYPSDVDEQWQRSASRAEMEGR